MDLQLDEGDFQGDRLRRVDGLRRRDGSSTSRGEGQAKEGPMDEKG